MGAKEGKSLRACSTATDGLFSPKTLFTQDEIQKAFFDQTSSTFFTTMLYFEIDGEVKSEPYCIVSDFKGYKATKDPRATIDFQ